MYCTFLSRFAIITKLTANSSGQGQLLTSFNFISNNLTQEVLLFTSVSYCLYIYFSLFYLSHLHASLRYTSQCSLTTCTHFAVFSWIGWVLQQKTGPSSRIRTTTSDPTTSAECQTPQQYPIIRIVDSPINYFC